MSGMVPPGSGPGAQMAGHVVTANNIAKQNRCSTEAGMVLLIVRMTGHGGTRQIIR
ncbi:MAG TPA: hypothetical protein VK753_04335 [Xanthomonadaceae bacterium]|nr:hypothetical protein [Xanthomonadaceae bacterium]